MADIAGGGYFNTVGSHCGGYTVTNGPHGAFYAAYQALGGRGLLGDPLSRVTAAGRGSYEQLVVGLVLAAPAAGRSAAGRSAAGRSAAGRSARALPIVAMLAKRAPAAYRRAGLPPARWHASAGVAERRGWLTNPSIRRAYLNGQRDSPRSYAAAVRRFGEPLGPPAALPGGRVGQAFADVVLEVPGSGGSARAAAVTPAALAARVLTVPRRALAPQAPPALPDPFPPGPAQPTSVLPFVFHLGAALFIYGYLVVRRRRAAAGAVEGPR